MTQTALRGPDEAPPVRRRRVARWLRPILGMGVSALFIWLAVRNLSWTDVRIALAGVDWTVVPLGVLCLAAGYSARITRWWLMLRVTGPEVRWREAGGPFLVSIAANNVLPLRIGDVLRLFAFRGRPGLEAGRVAGTLLVERLLDLFVLLAIFALVLRFVPASAEGAKMVRLAGWAAAAGALVLVALFFAPTLDRLVLQRIAGHPAVRRSALAGKVFGVIFLVVDTLRQLSRPGRAVSLVILSVLVWVLEGGVFVSATHAAGVPLDLAGAFFALSTATLSTLLPSSPGYLGTFHFFAMQAAIAFGAAPASAAAFAILVHLMLWAPTTVAGFIVFAVGSLRSGRNQSAVESTLPASGAAR